MLSALVLAVIPFGSCDPAREPQLEILASVVTGAMEIISGAPSTDPSVVAIMGDGLPICSGTLITPTVVVTAAHCFDHGPRGLNVHFGSDARPGSRDGYSIRATEIAVHPSYDGLHHDIALVRLSQNPGVRPKPVISAGVTPTLPGQLMRIVGFGISSNTGVGSGVKLEGLARVTGVSATELTHVPEPSATCKGDSGGPGFVFEGNVEVLAAVHVRGSCGGESSKTRVDVYVDSFIRPFLRGEPPAAPPPIPAPVEQPHTPVPIGTPHPLGPHVFDEVPGDPDVPVVDPHTPVSNHDDHADVSNEPFVANEIPGDPDPDNMYIHALEYLVRRDYANACPRMRRYLEMDRRGKFSSGARRSVVQYCQ